MKFAALFLVACHPHLDWVDASPTGDVATLVQAELAKNDGHQLIVYVGAKWCEPCRYFHEAAQAGALTAFAHVRFLAFDFDRDAQRLAQAGYASPLIPLFVIPESSGRASAKKIYGSIKGDGAVAEITPRLQALLKDRE